MLATMTKLFAKQLSRHIHLRTYFRQTHLLTLRNFYDRTLKIISIKNNVHYLTDHLSIWQYSHFPYIKINVFHTICQICFQMIYRLLTFLAEKWCPYSISLHLIIAKLRQLCSFYRHMLQVIHTFLFVKVTTTNLIWQLRQSANYYV